MELNIGKGKTVGGYPLIESEQSLQNKIINLKMVGGQEAVKRELERANKFSATGDFLFKLGVLVNVPALVLNQFGETRPFMWVSAGAIIAASFAYAPLHKLTMRRINAFTKSLKE